jgi:hypothetical protein
MNITENNECIDKTDNEHEHYHWDSDNDERCMPGLAAAAGSVPIIL